MLLLFSFIMRSNSKQTIKYRSNNHVVIRLPFIYAVIGLIDITFCISCIIISSLTSNQSLFVVHIIFTLFMIMGLCIVWARATWRAEIVRNADYFIYRSFFLKTYKIHYSDCVSYQIRANTIVLKTKNKTTYFDSMSTNVEYLLIMLRKNRVNRL